MKKQILIAAMALTTLAACQSDVNPLLVDWNTPYQTPPFNEIKVEHYAPAFDVAIAEAAVSAVLGTVLYIIALRKIIGKEESKK